MTAVPLGVSSFTSKNSRLKTVRMKNPAKASTIAQVGVFLVRTVRSMKQNCAWPMGMVRRRKSRILARDHLGREAY